MVKEAFNSGTDLRTYAKSVEASLSQVEQEHILDCMYFNFTVHGTWCTVHGSLWQVHGLSTAHRTRLTVHIAHYSMHEPYK